MALLRKHDNTHQKRDTDTHPAMLTIKSAMIVLEDKTSFTYCLMAHLIKMSLNEEQETETGDILKQS